MRRSIRWLHGKPRKHKRDGNNGKCGWVSGNPRYKRSKPELAKGMGRN